MRAMRVMLSRSLENYWPKKTGPKEGAGFFVVLNV